MVLGWVVNGISLTSLLSLGCRTIHLHHHCQSLGAREAVDGKQERNKSSRLADWPTDPGPKQRALALPLASGVYDPKVPR